MILKVTKIMNDGETFILKMPSVRIEDLANGMLHVYGSRFPIYRNTSSVKISKTVNRKKLSMKEFSSETGPRISQSKLYKTINELIEEYISY